jgi:hypothetical protein
MSDEHHKAEWHMTEETVPERPYNGEWRAKVAARLVLLFVAVVILIPLFPPFGMGVLLLPPPAPSLNSRAKRER